QDRPGRRAFHSDLARGTGLWPGPGPLPRPTFTRSARRVSEAHGFHATENLRVIFFAFQRAGTEPFAPGHSCSHGAGTKTNHGFPAHTPDRDPPHPCSCSPFGRRESAFPERHVPPWRSGSAGSRSVFSSTSPGAARRHLDRTTALQTRRSAVSPRCLDT